MRITYIENARLPTEKAHGYQIMKTVEQLRVLGADISLFVADRKNSLSPEDPFLYYGIKQTFPVHRLPVIDLMPFLPTPIKVLAYLLLRATFLRSVSRQGRELSASTDLFYTRDLATADVLKEFDRPIFVELHDDPRSNKRRWMRVKTHVTGWVVISHALEEILLAEGIHPSAICYAPDGFDETLFRSSIMREDARKQLNIPLEKTLIVYTGQLFPWKGMDALIPAIGRLPANTQLAIIGGDEKDRQRLIALDKENASLVACFHPRVPRADLLVWLAAADAALLSTSAKYEIGRLFTSPLKVFEYLAMGLPILASDVPSSREVLDESVALFFRPDDSNAFLEAVRAYGRYPLMQVQEMREAAKKRSAMYTWYQRSERIFHFCQRLGF
jgi:glycosyltransferase involved in cell wall biosynthesis